MSEKKIAFKACKNCKRLVSEKVCSGCGGQEFTTDFEGYLVIIDPALSVFAQVVHVNLKGDYALRINK